MAFRYFEDFRLGEQIDLGSHHVTEAEMLAFAREYDPQRIHTDRDFAARSGFGGLIASGWHTCAMFMRLLVDHLLMEASAIASPGVDGIRWIRPVRAGDVLRAEAEVVEITPSRTRADRGLVKHDCKVFNQQNELVMTLRTLALFSRRPLPAPGAAG
jgi:acyl dehydratase